ncbi:Methyltransferase domain protein [compost metagenome]
MPFSDSTFDVIFSACVFHHISHDEHIHWLSELLRVVKPGGLLAIFEHNPLNPLTVRVVNNCPFDENAQLIPSKKLKDRVVCAGWKEVKRNFRVFFPHMLSVLRPLERYMVGIPLGAQYVVFARG